MRISARFRDYKPRRITPLIAFRFLAQFPRRERKIVVRLLDHICYIKHSEAVQNVLSEVMQIVNKLVHDGTREELIFVVPASKAGKSSVVMFEEISARIRQMFPSLSFLSDGATTGIRDQIPFRSQSAVIFVDDFVGTGEQFQGSLKAWTEVLEGRDSRFFLVVAAACEEGKRRVEDGGAQVCSTVMHDANERMWAKCRTALSEEAWNQFAVLACELHSKAPFGHKNGGSMIVLERHCPNNVALVLRGTYGQRVWLGLFPRYDQLGCHPYDQAIRKLQPKPDSLDKP